MIHYARPKAARAGAEHPSVTVCGMAVHATKRDSWGHPVTAATNEPLTSYSSMANCPDCIDAVSDREMKPPLTPAEEIAAERLGILEVQ